MIKAIFPGGGKEGRVLESDVWTFRPGDPLKITLSEFWNAPNPEQPVVLHRTTNYKVKNFQASTLSDGTLEASFELRDVFTHE